MKNLNLQIKISPELYSKDPDSSELGRHIISKSIEMIVDLGFEKFTFKKLGEAINSNESSVYRYFSKKHILLIYLVNWYWSWINYRLVLETNTLSNPKDKLKKTIQILVSDVKQDSNFSYINEVLLNKIIITESSKAYHNINVDVENEKGFFKTYKQVVERVSQFIIDYDPDFEYPHMLVSTVIEGAHNQRFFADHLPALTDFKKGNNNIEKFYNNLVFKSLKQN